ncbi:WD40-repeat-containing domain protein [Tuber brumale]|nr:WD40-repeat-containing domain protein [Tuber brumale]
MQRRKLYRELNGPRGVGSNANFYGWIWWLSSPDMWDVLTHSGAPSFKPATLLIGLTAGSGRLVNIHTVYPDLALNTRIDTGHIGYIFSVKLMPHSSDRTILTAAGDAQVRIFDIEVAARPDIVPLKRYSYAENQHRVYKCHTSPVKRIITEDNPYTFLTCSEDRTVRQWDLRQPSGFKAMPAGSRSRGYYGMTVIDDKDEEDGAPSLISSRKWGIELHAVSCSTSRPFYIALGGRNLQCFLHDRRMTGRDLAAERGAGRGSSSISSSTASATAMDTATKCVRMFVPRPGSGGGWVDPQITSCKISDVHPDNILVSWRGDGVYMFSINQSPEEPSSGGDERRKETWNLDKRLQEPNCDCSSFSSFPPFSREGEESEAEGLNQHQDRDQTPSTPPQEHRPLTLAGLVTTLKQKLASVQTASSSPEAEEELAKSALAAATDTYRRIRHKILVQEQRNFAYLTPTALVGSEAEYHRLDDCRESARQRREAQDWVRAVGHYAYEVLLEQVDDDEKDFEELEYTPEVMYHTLNPVCGVAAGGREGGVEVVRWEQKTRLGFRFADSGGDGDRGGEGMLREYFTDLLRNAGSHPVRDPRGNVSFNSESDLITSLRTLMYSPSSPRTQYLKITLLPTLLLSIYPRIYTPSTAMPSIYSPPLHQTHHQPNPHTPTPTSHYLALYVGHCHILTAKDVDSFGQQDEYVISGSDDGNLFIWDTHSAQIVNILEGSGVVNVVTEHPQVPILAAAGTGHQVDIFGVEGGSTAGRGRMEDLDEILNRSPVTSEGWRR